MALKPVLDLLSLVIADVVQDEMNAPGLGQYLSVKLLEKGDKFSLALALGGSVIDFAGSDGEGVISTSESAFIDFGCDFIRGAGFSRVKTGSQRLMTPIFNAIVGFRPVAPQVHSIADLK